MGLSPTKQIIMVEEGERMGLVRMPDQGITQVGPTIMRYGTEAQKKKYLPPILAGAVAATPVVMTSTEAGPRDIAAARAAGANYYLVKPVAAEELRLCAAVLTGQRP